MSDNIIFDAPFDVVECIFTHLPVKILLSYRIISKSYRDLIDSRYFANLHCGHSMRTRSNRNILCRSAAMHPFQRDEGMHCVDVYTLNHSVLKCPKGWDYFSQFVSSCNGVVVLYNGYKELTIWNPAIRTYADVLLPHLNIPNQSFNGNYVYNFGFGYDRDNDDYKVIMLVQFVFTAVLNGEDIVREVYAFSLKSNMWRKIGDFPYYVRETGCHGTYIDGALYWVCVEETVDSSSPNLIVAFDLATEEYRVVQTPVYQNISSEVGIRIGSVEHSLWAYCYRGKPFPGILEDDLGRIADIWLLEQRDGEEDSWTKLASFDDPTKYYKPLAYSSLGMHILILDKHVNLSWYDLVKREQGRKINVRGLPSCYDSDVCVESLVHLDGGANDGENQRIREKMVIEDKIGRSNEDSIFSMMANFATELIWKICEL